MQRWKTALTRQRLLPTGTPAWVVQPPPEALPKSGQFFMVWPEHGQAAARYQVQPAAVEADQFAFSKPKDSSWVSGDILDVLGPMGRGFQPPRSSRRWLLLDLGLEPEPLFPLMGVGLLQRASVVYWSPVIPPGLPPEVEALADPREAVPWAEYIALSGSLEGIRSFRSSQEDLFQTLMSSQAEILLKEPLACGLGGCLACAVRCARGWKLVCVEGPVFPLQALRW